VSLTVADNGTWEPRDEGTGLSIVRALVRDELNGKLLLRGDAGLTAEVTFQP
jgi:two-component sensor histidine kinase